MRESGLFGLTQMSRVLRALCHALVVLLPLLGLMATGLVINRSREDGTFELLFAHPLRRDMWFLGMTLTRYLTLFVPLVVVTLGFSLLQIALRGQAVEAVFLSRMLALCAGLLAAFVGIGLAISTFVSHPARAMMYVLLTWGLSIAFVDFVLIGLMLKWQFQPQLVFALAALNPVEAARIALLSDIEPELATLGPVGFYLSNQLGSNTVFYIGLVWPTVLGIGTWFAALTHFKRSDLV